MEDKRTRMDQGGPDDLIVQRSGDWASHSLGTASRAALSGRGQLNQVAAPSAFMGALNLRGE